MFESNPITIDDIRLVVGIIHGKSITILSRESGFSCGKIKDAVDRVENAYHCVLFTRNAGKRHSPTPEAFLLLDTLEGILQKHDEGRRIVVPSVGRQAIRVMPIPVSLLRAIVPDFNDFSSLFMGVKIVEDTFVSRSIEKAIAHHALDCAILPFPDDDEGVVSIRFHRDVLCAMVPSDSPLAFRKFVSMDELSGFPLTYMYDHCLFLQKERVVYKDVVDKCSHMHCDPRDLAFVSGVESIGIVILFDLHKPYVPATHCLVPIAGLCPRDICFVFAKDRGMDPRILPLRNWFERHEI